MEILVLQQESRNHIDQIHHPKLRIDEHRVVDEARMVTEARDVRQFRQRTVFEARQRDDLRFFLFRDLQGRNQFRRFARIGNGNHQFILLNDRTVNDHQVGIRDPRDIQPHPDQALRQFCGRKAGTADAVDDGFAGVFDPNRQPFRLLDPRSSDWFHR